MSERPPKKTDPAYRFGQDWAEEGAIRVVVPEQCSRCKHLASSVRWTCSAFPNGIPAPILTNRYDHRFPYAGDKGIRFEPVDEE